MIKDVANFFFTLAAVFGMTQALATEIYPFFLERPDGTVVEGYFSPPSTKELPIIFAVQGASLESVSKWHVSLSDQASALGLGVITLEKQGISRVGTDLLTYSQTNCLEQRRQDYELCLKNMHLICPEWAGKSIFWGESEGGLLAANLAVQEPKTAAVLLFATGGGMKPREEVKWSLWHSLEQQGTSEEEKEAYMKFLDEQMDVMVLDPTADKQFLGSTYKWWASLLATEEVSTSLSCQSLPVYLAHGIEDGQIPIQSADLAAEAIAKTNRLTYLRLEGRSHDLGHQDVQNGACQWLSSILLQQEKPIPIQVAVRRPSLRSRQANSADYILCRDPEDSESGMGGRGDWGAGMSGDKDSDGNESVTGKVYGRYDFGNGWSGQAKGEATTKKDREGNIKSEAHVEAEVSRKF